LDIDGAGGLIGKRLLVEIRKVFQNLCKRQDLWKQKMRKNVISAEDLDGSTNMVIAGDGHV